MEVLGASEVLIEVGGVGYRVSVPLTAMSGITVGASAFLHVHTHVREDAIVLYGFADREGRECFEGLIAAHGVGPSLALAILSVHSPAALCRAVLAGDSAALTLVPGVGAKTAARLLIDLEPRFSRLGLGAGEEIRVSGHPAGGGGALAEVRAALASLGYAPEEIRSAIGALEADDLSDPSNADPAGSGGAAGSVEELLRRALRELAATRRRVRA